MKKVFLFLVLIVAVSAQAVNQSYYSSLNGKKDDELREALTELLYTKHTKFVSYNWDFPYDYDSDGNMLDIYSSCGYNNHNTYPSSYKCCCDAVNREHVVCQSNFGGSDNNGKVPQYSDRHHLYPVDGRANGHRSDLPFGECSGGQHGSCNSGSTIIPTEGTSTCSNHEYGKSGASTFNVALPSGGGSVYEVGDEYKGDIARAVLYMVVRYADKAHCRLPDGAKNATTNLTTANDYPVTAWANTEKNKVGQMFSSSLSTNHGLSNYGMAILLKWHRQDPVSQKEIDRNDGVETAQGNRNPFVDYPYLVEYLWGGKKDNNFNTSDVLGSFEDGFTPGVSDGSKVTVSTPTIVRPTEDIDLGSTNTGNTITKSVIIQGANLASGLTLAVTGTNASYFTLSQATMTQSVATNGKAITIEYHPTAAGEHSATLQISGGGLENAHEVALSGSCCDQYSITLYRNGQAEQLLCCGTYTLPTASTESDACEGWTFKGWTTTSAVDGTTAPTYTTQVTGATTLYAVYGQTEGTGGSNTEFTLFSGELVEGDYIIYYSSRAMKAFVSNNRLQYETVTPTDNIITSTNDSIIWHIAASGDYWTLYNAKTANYAASTGAEKKAQLLTDGTDDKSLWTCSSTSASTTYEFVNKQNAANNVKDTLRNNSTYGFACYSNKTGGALSLYKRGTAVTTYKTIPCPYYSISLADEDGFVSGGQYFVSETSAQAGTTITLEAEAEEGYLFDSWSVTKADDAQTSVTVTNNQFTMPEYNVLVKGSFEEIPTYTATWMANGSKHASQNGLYAGDTPDIPSTPVANCSDDRIFVGWTTDATYFNATTAPADTFTTTAPAIDSDDITFYAVYADKETDESANNEFNLFSGALVEGDYVLYYSGKVMKNAINSGTRFDYEEITPSKNTITEPDSSVIWHIAADGNYWTLYNAKIKKYAAGKTGKSGKNQGALLDAVDDFARWTCNTNGVEYDFENKGRAALASDQAPENRFLRNNGTYGFACYATATGDSLTLYKRSSSTVTTYSNYSVHCSEATYTVTFKNKGTTIATRSGHAGEEIEAVATPTSDCSSYAFLGWSTTQYNTNNTTAPTIDYTGRFPASDITYYAVFSNEASALTNNFQRITEVSNLKTGNYVIAGYNTAYYALSTVPKASYYLDGIAITPNEDIITTTGDSIIWKITVNGDQVTIYNETKGFIYIEQSGKYYNIKLGDNTTSNKFTYGVSDDSWTFTSVTYPQVIEYYATGGRWTFYSTPDAPIYLFKQKTDPDVTVIYTTSPNCLPTDFEEQSSEKASVRKIFRDGQLFIIRGEKVYTIQGLQIQ